MPITGLEMLAVDFQIGAKAPHVGDCWQVTPVFKSVFLEQMTTGLIVAKDARNYRMQP
jgi:hypothetical protein